MRRPIIVVGLAAGLAATGLAMFVGLTLAEAVTHLGCSGVSKVRTAGLRARAGRNAIDQFVVDHGRCPSGHQELIAQRYLDARNLHDPWGTGIELGCAALEGDTIVTAWSAGPDRVFGTPDDIGAD